MRQTKLTSAFITFRSRLRAMAAGMAGQSEAEDIVHDAFVRLWASNPEVADEAAATRLAFTSVRNTAIDNLRRRGTHPSGSLDDSLPIADEAARIPDSPPEGPTPEEVSRAVVALSLRILSGRQLEVFRLHDLSGWDYDEIADHLSMTQENVRMTLSRARKAIREAYRQSSSTSNDRE